MPNAVVCYRRSVWILAPMCLILGIFDLFVVPRLGWDERTHDFSNGFVVGMTTVLLLAILLLRRRFVDERFAGHARRSLSLGGAAGILVAVGLFDFHLIARHEWHSELLAVAFAIAGVHLLAMLWYLLHD